MFQYLTNDELVFNDGNQIGIKLKFTKKLNKT